MNKCIRVARFPRQATSGCPDMTIVNQRGSKKTQEIFKEFDYTKFIRLNKNIFYVNKEILIITI